MRLKLSVVLTALIVLAACEKSYIPFQTSPEADTVKYTYYKYRDFLVAGQWEAAYQILSTEKKGVWTFEQFKKYLEPTWPQWRDRLGTVEVVSVGVDPEGVASLAAKVAGLSLPPEIVEFVREPDGWKINHIIPPGAVGASLPR